MKGPNYCVFFLNVMPINTRAKKFLLICSKIISLCLVFKSWEDWLDSC